MINHDFLKSPKWKEQQWRANRIGAHVEILEFERIMVRRARKISIPLFTHAVMRTKEEQDRLFVMGRSKVQYANAPHCHGCACDIVHSIRAWDLNEAEWTILGHIGKQVAASLGIKITWGGDWSFYDPAHWELADWRSRLAE